MGQGFPSSPPPSFGAGTSFGMTPGMNPFSPPPGVVPNYEDPVSRAGQLLATNIACLTIAGIFVSLRLYSQIYLVKKVAWDDLTCVLALLLSIAFSVSSMKLTELGLGKHMWDVPFTTFAPGFLRMNVVVTSMYPPLIFLVKLTILLLYIRLLGISTKTRFAAIALIIFSGGYAVAGFFTITFACTPRRKIWDITYRGGSCLNIKAMVITGASFNVLTDILVLVVPMPVVWFFLTIPRKQKIALTGVFMTGSFVCIVSIIRLKEAVESFRTSDVTWAEFDTILWSVVEVNVGIACVCMPCLKILIQKTFPRALESSAAAWNDTKTFGSSSTRTAVQYVAAGRRRPSAPVELYKITERTISDIEIAPPHSDVGDGSGYCIADVSGYIHVDQRGDLQGVGQA